MLLSLEEELKSRLDAFVLNTTKKIQKKELIPEIQQEYDELIEFINKLEILTTDDFEKIELETNNCLSELKKSQEKVNLLTTQKKVLEEKIKLMQEELLKNSTLEEQYKTLNDNYNILKEKNIVDNEEISNYQIKLRNNEILVSDLQKELDKVKQENFEKGEKITNYEREIKEKEAKIRVNIEKINIITDEKNNLLNLNDELKIKNSEQRKSYENKIKILEKQLKHLSDANNNFVQENNEVHTQLKDFQMITNMAKANTKKLNKEDFSILEVMSKRADNAEMEVQKLNSYVDELKSLNEQIKNKIKPLEDYALLQIKHDHEIRVETDTIFDIQNKVFTEEQKREIFKLKNDPNELFQALIRLKTENLELHKQIKDITIECNQQLREIRWKNK